MEGAFPKKNAHVIYVTCTSRRRSRATERAGRSFTASTGELVSLFRAHMRRYWSRPDIAYLSVTDVDALPYALVWRSESENDPIRALAQTVRDLGPMEAAQ